MKSELGSTSNSAISSVIWVSQFALPGLRFLTHGMTRTAHHSSSMLDQIIRHSLRSQCCPNTSTRLEARERSPDIHWVPPDSLVLCSELHLCHNGDAHSSTGSYYDTYFTTEESRDPESSSNTLEIMQHMLVRTSSALKCCGLQCCAVSHLLLKG